MKLRTFNLQSIQNKLTFFRQVFLVHWWSSISFPYPSEVPFRYGLLTGQMEEYYACIIDFCPVSGEDLKNKSKNLHKAVFNTIKVVEPPIYEPEHSFYFLQERQCLLCVSFYILINFISSIHIFSSISSLPFRIQEKT